ncbi:zinc ribbon domain-containing protein [Butyrivibrio proteoclasticus]|uniref:zinc ribbon domain-containing protein n=1 Tax=Butyrivibrio proteoclasticus TaxID=43305 RepID=UPI0004799B23|nr:zinc ribbon domain-containing protein [Butyrivibrio proteoclasticus]
MKKVSKLGLSAGLLTALIYLGGAASTFVAVGLIVFTLVYEEDEEIKAAAKKAAVLVAILMLVSVGSNTLLDFLQDSIRTFQEDYYDNGFYKFLGFFNGLIQTGVNGAFFVLALIQLLGGSQPKAAQPQVGYNQMPQQNYAQAPQQNYQAPQMQAATQPRVCPNCGNQVPDGVAFCTNCGTKI